MTKAKTRNHDIDIEKKKSNAGGMSHPECVGCWWCFVFGSRDTAAEKRRRNGARCAVKGDGPDNVQE